MSEPTKVTTGSKVFDVDGERRMVKPPCESKTGGRWYCTTHRVLLDEFSKSQHYDRRGPHLMAWRCNEHGVEQP